ncbi:hypothetical protein [Schlesneria sp. DSM 10557]|uniref:hypothetical protein n=1 Tax=Schlesneria sp. DSM 10557 TaxID=3044399 RepID=UPI0035A15515
MLNSRLTRPENTTAKSRGKLTLLSWLLVVTSAGQVVNAEDELRPSTRMLEDLKQRSATERWQRLKRAYPADTSGVAGGIPSPLPNETPRSVTTEEVPPLTSEGQLIPRLTAVPLSDNSDWVKPGRPQEVIEEVMELPELSNTALPEERSKLVPSPAADSPLPVRIAVADVEEDGEIDARSSEEGSESTPSPKSSTLSKDGGGSPRTPIERLIGSINPHYDRDEDADIRNYARQQAKEFNITFTPKPAEERAFPQITLAWEASNYWHYPLYFEDPALERTGHSHHPIVQPFASIGRAAVQLGLLPYQMVIVPPCKHEYPVGWYRPGDCAPKLHYQIPLNAEAALVEAGVVTGLYFVIP